MTSGATSSGTDWPPTYRKHTRQNQIVIGTWAAPAAFAYAAGGYQVICDGITGPWFIDVFRAAAAARSIPLHYVILRPDQATALHRAVSRGDHALTNPEPIRSLHHQFTGIGAFERHLLDSSQLSAQATADAFLHGLAEDTYHLAPQTPGPSQTDQSTTLDNCGPYRTATVSRARQSCEGAPSWASRWGSVNSPGPSLASQPRSASRSSFDRSPSILGLSVLSPAAAAMPTARSGRSASARTSSRSW